MANHQLSLVTLLVVYQSGPPINVIWDINLQCWPLVSRSADATCRAVQFSTLGGLHSMWVCPRIGALMLFPLTCPGKNSTAAVTIIAILAVVVLHDDLQVRIIQLQELQLPFSYCLHPIVLDNCCCLTINVGCPVLIFVVSNPHRSPRQSALRDRRPSPGVPSLSQATPPPRSAAVALRCGLLGWQRL